MIVAIWKYTLGPNSNEIEMPADARVLSTAFQDKNLQIWEIGSPSNARVKRVFYVCGTGWTFYDASLGIFVGTAHHPDGLFFHVFDQGQRSPAGLEVVD